jgi:hypothetical protein
MQLDSLLTKTASTEKRKKTMQLMIIANKEHFSK